MYNNTNIIVRALELARDPDCNSIADVKAVLFKEGYEGVHGHFSGQSMCRQLKRLIAERRAAQQTAIAE
jgi:hypothetical protein